MEGGKKAEQTLADEKSKGKQKMEKSLEDEGEKSKAKQKMEELFKQASEFDSMFGSKSAIVVFGSDGKVRSSSGDVKSVFDLFASRMDVDDDDCDDDDEEDEDEDDDEDLEEMIQEFCKKSESEIVELKKAALAEKDVEKKKKLEEEVVKKTEEYESTIEDLEKNVDAGINRMRGVDDRKSNGGGPFSSSST